VTCLAAATCLGQNSLVATDDERRRRGLARRLLLCRAVAGGRRRAGRAVLGLRALFLLRHGDREPWEQRANRRAGFVVTAKNSCLALARDGSLSYRAEPCHRASPPAHHPFMHDAVSHCLCLQSASPSIDAYSITLSFQTPCALLPDHKFVRAFRPCLSRVPSPLSYHQLCDFCYSPIYNYGDVVFGRRCFGQQGILCSTAHMTCGPSLSKFGYNTFSSFLKIA
jgi:hypothetical protein